MEIEYQTRNDALSWFHAGEWDDFYTAGVQLSLHDTNWRLATGLNLLTLRGLTPADPGSRVDELFLRYGYQWRDSGAFQWWGYGMGTAWLPGVRLNPWLQASLYGDFGGLGMQQSTHDGAGLTRPVPTSYAVVPPEVSLGTVVDLSWRPGGELTVRANAELAGRATVRGVSGLIGAAGSMTVGAARSTLDLEAGWTAELGTPDGSTVGDTAPAHAANAHPGDPRAASRAVMSGPYVRTESTTGPLRVIRYAYPVSGWGWGAIALRLSLLDAWTSDGGTIPMLTDIGTRPDGLFYRQRTTLYPAVVRVGSSLRGRVGGGTTWGSGWLGDEAAGSVQRGWGFWLPAEAEVAWSPGLLWVAGYASAGPGTEIVRRFTDEAVRADLRAEAAYFSVRGALGVRLGVVVPDARIIGLAVELGHAGRLQLAGSPGYEPALPGWELAILFFASDSE